MKYRLTAILIGLAILAPPASGSVFWRWRADANRAVFDATPGWQRVYQAPVRVNDSQGRLEILNCADSLPDVMAKLNRAFPDQANAAFRHSESAGWGRVQTDATTTRILALAPGTAEHTLVFVLTQSPEEYTRSLKPPAAHLLDEAPVYPGSVAQTFLADEQASMRLEISEAPGGPEAIRDFFASALAQNGYQALPAADASLAIFQKGRQICCVLVQPSSQGRASVITVLHKHLKME